MRMWALKRLRPADVDPQLERPSFEFVGELTFWCAGIAGKKATSRTNRVELLFGAILQKIE